jgi:cobalt-zinc-cadmium efflux system protein
MRSHKAKSIERRFLIAIAITFATLAVEIVGGWWTGSLALLSDAAHVFLDIFALALSYSALRLSALPANENYTFGYHRFEVFASLINGVTLAFISAGIFYEAYRRFIEPRPVFGPELLVIAAIGLVANLAVALILGGHGHDHDSSDEHHDEGKETNGHVHHETEDANVESAMYHVLGDAISSLGVIAAGAIIWKTGWTLADPLAGAFIGIIIIAGSWRVIKSSAHILMEGTPACLSIRAIEENICQSPGVAGVHDLHIWNLCSHHALLSAHVVMDDMGRTPPEEIMRRLKLQLKDEFGIEHSTLQMERECCERELVCTMGRKNSGGTNQ